MDFDDHFNGQLFTNPSKRREGMFLDRKSEIYPIFDDKEKLADFIVDFIALANMSYRYGKVSRILFGITDHYELVGVKGQATRKKHLANVDYENERDLEKLFRECIEHDFRRAIEQYVDPKSVEIQMHWGIAENSALLVSYLEIGAQLSNRTAYRTKKEIKGTRIHAGMAWKREGEHNKQLSEDEFVNWLSHNECPVISRENWKFYFDKLRAGRFAQAMNLTGYIEPKSSQSELLQSVVNNFLNSGDRRVMIIEGHAGMGKTEFMRRLVFNIAEDARPYLDFNVPDDKPPGSLIPIYRELRDERFDEKSDLAKQAIKWLNTEGKLFTKLPSNGQRLLSRADTNWVLCLDGLDEIRDKKSIRAFWCCLREFIDIYPKVKVIISSRPDAIDPIWRRDFDVVTIAMLTDEEILHHFDSIAYQEEKELASQVLKDCPELLQEIRNPLYLKAFANALFKEQDQRNPVSLQPIKEASIPEPKTGDLSPEAITQYTSNLEYDEPIDEPIKKKSKDNDLEQIDEYPDRFSCARIIKQMLDMILEHDRKNLYELGQPSEIKQGIERLKALAAKVDGQKKFDHTIANKQLTKKRVDRYLSLGLIEIADDSLSFPRRLFQVYMAADHVWCLWCARRKNMIINLIAQPNEFWLEVQRMFNQFAYDNEAIDFISQLVRSEEKSPNYIEGGQNA